MLSALYRIVLKCCVLVALVVVPLAAAQAEWVGIARSGDWGNRILTGNSLKELLDRSQREFDQNGLRLTAIVPYRDGQQQRWVGIARFGDWGNRILTANSLKELLDRSQREFDQNGLRLTTIVPYR